ncbi:MAG: hypothetical protein AB7E96_02845 [Deferribacterales bacterium]
MLNKEFVFILENEKNTLVINLNNFNTVEFDDTKMIITVDHGTSERTVEFDNKKNYEALKDQIINALADEE